MTGPYPAKGKENLVLKNVSNRTKRTITSNVAKVNM